jgi:hypothetical protein
VTKSDDQIEVFYTYTLEERAARSELIEAIEAEKRMYLERIDPYVKLLANIQGTPHIVVRPSEAGRKLALQHFGQKPEVR